MDICFVDVIRSVGVGLEFADIIQEDFLPTPVAFDTDSIAVSDSFILEFLTDAWNSDPCCAESALRIILFVGGSRTHLRTALNQFSPPICLQLAYVSLKLHPKDSDLWGFRRVLLCQEQYSDDLCLRAISHCDTLISSNPRNYHLFREVSRIGLMNTSRFVQLAIQDFCSKRPSNPSIVCLIDLFDFHL